MKQYERDDGNTFRYIDSRRYPVFLFKALVNRFEKQFFTSNNNLDVARENYAVHFIKTTRLNQNFYLSSVT